jgi:hypothetical protein
LLKSDVPGLLSAGREKKATAALQAFAQPKNC